MCARRKRGGFDPGEDELWLGSVMSLWLFNHYIDLLVREMIRGSWNEGPER